MNTQADLVLVHVSITPAPATVAKGWTWRWVFIFNPSSSDCVPSASLTQGGVREDILLPLVRAMGQVESVMAAAQQDAAFLSCTASAKGFHRGSKAFLKQYFKYISGLNALDKPVSGGFQHILLGLTHFPFWFADLLKNSLTVQGSRSFNRVFDKFVLFQ